MLSRCACNRFGKGGTRRRGLAASLTHPLRGWRDPRTFDRQAGQEMALSGAALLPRGRVVLAVQQCPGELLCAHLCSRGRLVPPGPTLEITSQRCTQRTACFQWPGRVLCGRIQKEARNVDTSARAVPRVIPSCDRVMAVARSFHLALQDLERFAGFEEASGF